MSIINYIGINEFNIDSYDYSFPFSFDGSITLDDNIDDLLCFSAINEIINYNCIDTFELSNLENYQVNSCLSYVNSKFSLIFEYSLYENNTVNAKPHFLFKSFVFPLNIYLNNNINIYIFVKDLYCKKSSDNTIFYNINIVIAINTLLQEDVYG